MATTCPDCDEQLHPIKIIDATYPGASREGIQHVELSYAAVGAKPSFFTGSLKKEGTIRAMLCPRCGRILLYADPG